jgi:hypothetical protein
MYTHTHTHMYYIYMYIYNEYEALRVSGQRARERIFFEGVSLSLSLVVGHMCSRISMRTHI